MEGMAMIICITLAFFHKGDSQGAPGKIETQQFDEIMKFTFLPHNCIQVLTDWSDWALQLANLVYQTDLNVTIHNGEGRLEKCKGHLVIADSAETIWRLSLDVDLSYENRVLLLVSEMKNDGILHNSFRDSDVLLVHLKAPPRYAIKKQPTNAFQEVKELRGSWTEDLQGYELNNFMGREAIIGTFNCTVFSSLGPLNEAGRPAWTSGVEMTLIKEIFNRLNLSMKVVVPSTVDKWGRFVKDKWEDGIMGLISSKDVDISFCGLWLVPTMILCKMDIFLPLTEGCLKMLVPRPVYLDSKWLSLFQPFAVKLWVLTGLSWLSASFLLFILPRVHPLVITNSSRNKLTYTESVFMAVALFVSAGSGKVFSSFSRRITIWWIFLGFILTTSYSSSLITQLTSPNISVKMNTIRQLVENGFEWTSPYIPDMALLLDFDEPWEREWAQRLKVIENKEEEINYINSKKVAFFGQQYGKSSFSLDYDYPNELLQNFEVTKKCLKKYMIGPVLRPGSPFFKPILKYILRFHNSGITNKLLYDEFERMAATEPYVREVFRTRKLSVKGVVKLKLRNLKGAFLGLGAGSLLALLVFAGELLWRGKRRSRI